MCITHCFIFLIFHGKEQEELEQQVDKEMPKIIPLEVEGGRRGSDPRKRGYSKAFRQLKLPSETYPSPFSVDGCPIPWKLRCISFTPENSDGEEGSILKVTEGKDLPVPGLHIIESQKQGGISPSQSNTEEAHSSKCAENVQVKVICFNQSSECHSVLAANTSPVEEHSIPPITSSKEQNVSPGSQHPDSTVNLDITITVSGSITESQAPSIQDCTAAIAESNDDASLAEDETVFTDEIFEDCAKCSSLFKSTFMGVNIVTGNVSLVCNVCGTTTVMRSAYQFCRKNQSIAK